MNKSSLMFNIEFKGSVNMEENEGLQSALFLACNDVSKKTVVG